MRLLCSECDGPGSNCIVCQGEGYVENTEIVSRTSVTRRPSGRLAVAAAIPFPFHRRSRRKWLLPTENN